METRTEIKNATINTQEENVPTTISMERFQKNEILKDFEENWSCTQYRQYKTQYIIFKECCACS